MPLLDCYCGTTIDGKDGVDDEFGKVEEVLECNYEQNCTPLYKKIESGAWEDVALFLDSGYWPGHFFMDTISPADQTKTWVTRFEPEGEKIKWSQLPLHLSIVVNAPFGVVRRLVELFPKSVQCTDDELMLPLHLAMRHAASDSVVDLFLSKFPMAVNAKGKNGRTPLECAFRSNKKARARVLAVFIQQSRTDDINEVQTMRAILDDKEQAIVELQSKLTMVEKEKTMTEFEMSQKVSSLLATKLQLENSLEQLKHAKEQIEGNLSKMIDEYQASKLHDDLETDRKIQALEESATELKDAANRIREEEQQLLSDLKKIETTIEETKGGEDVTVLRNEIERIRSNRLELKRVKTMEEMEALKDSLLKNIEDTDDETKEEINSMRKVIENIQSKEFHVQSHEELANLRKELVSLRDELKMKREVSKTKAELFALKKSLHTAQKTQHGKEDLELERLRRIVDPMQIGDIDNKGYDELTKIRTELTVLRKKLQERQLMNELQREVAEIRIALSAQLKDATDRRKKDLQEGIASANKIQRKLDTSTSQMNHLALKLEIVALKDEMKEKEAQYKMKSEIEFLKSAIDDVIKQADGQKKKDLHAMKSAVEAIATKKHNSRNFVELLTIKKEFNELKLNMVPKAAVTKVKEELQLMKSMLAQQMKENDSKTKDKLLVILEQLEGLQSKKIENLKRTEFNEVKIGIIKMWKKMAEMEEVLRAKEELNALKQQLTADLSKAKGNNRKELLVVKHTIDSIDLDAIETKNHDDWNALKKELESVKMDLKKKELRALKRILEHELKNPGTKSPEELHIMKEACNSINLFALETATNSELNHWKSQIDSQLNKINNKEGTKKKKGLFGLFGFGKKRHNALRSVSFEKMKSEVKTVRPPRVPHNPTPSVVSESSEEDEEIEYDEMRPTNEKSMVGWDGEVEVMRARSDGAAFAPEAPHSAAQ